MLKGVLDKFRFYWIEIKVHGLGYYGEGSGGGGERHLFLNLREVWEEGRFFLTHNMEFDPKYKNLLKNFPYHWFSGKGFPVKG